MPIINEAPRLPVQPPVTGTLPASAMMQPVAAPLTGAPPVTGTLPASSMMQPAVAPALNAAPTNPGGWGRTPANIWRRHARPAAAGRPPVIAGGVPQNGTIGQQPTLGAPVDQNQMPSAPLGSLPNNAGQVPPSQATIGTGIVNRFTQGAR